MQNCLGCYLKLNWGSTFQTEVATYLLHIKLRTLYTLNIIYSITKNCDPIHDMSSNFHTKIAIQLYKIISDTAYLSHSVEYTP